MTVFFLEICTLLSTPHPFPLPSSCALHSFCSHPEKPTAEQETPPALTLAADILLFCPETTTGVSQNASAGLKLLF